MSRPKRRLHAGTAPRVEAGEDTQKRRDRQHASSTVSPASNHERETLTSPQAGVAARPARRYGRWRAVSLITLYLLIGLHIAHWKIAGRTLAPLELNEVMYTLELGIITAGFIFMVLAAISVAFFGRFFCSWGCHILALEDLSAWILRKLKIRPRPVRSRLLLFVPSGVLFYMFLWPQVLRIAEGRPFPRLRILGDADGWASFVTTNFWRNLPGPWVTTLTFLVCGFLIIYFLGSRSFCTYACPYGVVFSLADRVALGKIVSRGNCAECGKCTAACQSHIRVHEELGKFGRVVNPACMKDLDCVSACPEGNVTYAMSRPGLFRSWRKHGRFGVPYDFSLTEEIVMVAVFLGSILIFRGLYGAVPFLMTLGLGIVLAYLTVVGSWMIRRPNLRLSHFRIKREGALTPAGRIVAVLGLLVLAITAHSAFIRYHEWSAHRAFDLIAATGGQAEPSEVASALTHYGRVERWGLLRPPDLDHRVASLLLLQDDPRAAEPYLRRALDRDSGNLETRVTLAAVLLTREEVTEAIQQLTAVITARPEPEPGSEPARTRAAAHEMLGRVRAELGDRAGAAASLRAALERWPESPGARAALEELGFATAGDAAPAQATLPAGLP